MRTCWFGCAQKLFPFTVFPSSKEIPIAVPLFAFVRTYVPVVNEVIDIFQSLSKLSRWVDEVAEKG